MNQLLLAAIFAGFFSNSLVLGQSAFTIGGVTTTVAQIAEQEKAEFYKIEEKRYQLIEQTARDKYLEYFWQQRATNNKKSVAQEKKDYFKQRIKVDKTEIDKTIEQFKSNPRLSKMSEEERRVEIGKYLRQVAETNLISDIVKEGIRSKKLVINYPRPIEPSYDITILPDDPVKYGPEDNDTTPVNCRGDDCITIVEYSEFQCPYCARILPTSKEVLTKYKGKVRWVVRDFPLSFHNRAKPAAVAARCALDQGKFWQMYTTLFNNQRSLSDKDFVSYAKQIKLNNKVWQKCVDNPSKALAKVEANFQSGVKLGVTGTPAFFVNGRKLSGAMPFSDFKRIIDEELAKKSS